MAFCPHCRTEFVPGTALCQSCGAALVESLPEEGSNDTQEKTRVELVELATFPNFSEAEMIQELLEANGIQSVLRGETDPIGPASGATPSTLMVDRDDLPSAHQIYEDYFAGEVEEAPQLEEEQDEEEGAAHQS